MLTEPKKSAVFHCLVYSLVLTFIFSDTLSWLVFHDWARGDFNYGYLIPAIVVYLIWEKRDDLKVVASRTSWRGLWGLLVGFIFFWVGELSGEFFSQYLAFWLMVISLAYMQLREEKIKKLWFPLAFILTMFPIPQLLTNRLSLELKLLSSKLGVWMMQAYGMSAYREGNII
ncbi:MAG: archaeosortase/exosortase family protein, partial [Deltaproteobacteria bacterium]|nr:archaeosortase/exosortase family protein [Deltaproteobacteria bacterium]